MCVSEIYFLISNEEYMLERRILAIFYNFVTLSLTLNMLYVKTEGLVEIWFAPAYVFIDLGLLLCLSSSARKGAPIYILWNVVVLESWQERTYLTGFERRV